MSDRVFPPEVQSSEPDVEAIARSIAPYTGAIAIVCGEVASYYSGFNLSEFARRLLASRPAAQGVQEPSADEIYEALTIAAEAVCEIRCPSKWKTSEPQPHSEECKKVRAARSAWMDHCSYQDLIASGGLPKDEGPELPSAEGK